MKFRLVKRARGWVIQKSEYGTLDQLHEQSDKPVPRWSDWREVTSWRWHWVAALHLLWLRKRARK